MDWTAIVGPGALVVLGSAASAVIVAVIGRRQAAEATLPDHFMRELERLAAEDARKRERLDAVEAYLIVLGDHIDVLEAHIWQQLPPPPPARPRFIPGGSDASAQ